MQLKSLIIKNFGKHSHIEINPIVGNVIGIVGHNGAGKSTIMSAIQYLFTGDTGNGTIESCIKRGESSLYVECTFEKDGVTGKLWRKASKKSPASRYLQWGDNPPITREKECAEALEEILGIDKQSLLNTIFISQGEIANILAPSVSKRIDLFSKLLNLNFINKRAYLLDEKITQLKSTVVDLTPLKDSLALKEKECNDKYYEIEKEANDLKLNYGDNEFVNNLFDQCSDYIKLSNEFEILQSESNYKNTLDSVKRDINIITQKYNLKSEDLDVNITNIKQSVSALNVELETLIKQKHNKQIISEHYNKFTDLNEKIYRFKYLSDIFERKDPKYIRDLINQFYVYIKEKNNIHELQSKITYIKQQTDLIIQNSDKLKKELSEKQQSVNDIDKSIFNVSCVIKQLTTLKDAKLKLKNILKKDTAVCPQCGLKLVLGQEICDGDISSIDNQISNSDVQFKQLTRTRENLVLETDNINLQLTDISNTLNKNIGEINASESIIKDFKINPGLEKLADKINLYKDNIEEYNRLFYLNIETELNNEINSLKALLNCGDINQINIEAIVSDSNLIDKDISNIKNKIDNYNNILSELSRLQLNLNSATGLFNDWIQRCNNIKQSINNHTFKKLISFDIVDKKYKYDTFNILSIRDKSLDVIDKYKNIDADKRVLDKMRDMISSEKTRINNLELSNINTYNKIDELQRIKCLLMPKDGITKQYLNYLFGCIVNYVSEFLGYMDSNFIIEVEDRSDKEDLSFKFKRIDINDDNWYEMSKLSGGQRIKLSIAFLIAIQKVICPSICFLVLDESTTHLDAESVDALNTLFEQVGTIFGNQGGQIWVIDHTVSLQRSFSQTITLQ